jgi:hypothetical protein
MRRTALLLPFLAAAVVAMLAGPANAQATRTWVSGVGDDANPCSRTAPCKTFAGAISKTAAGGEINVLDPGGFGGVTITKSITISSEGFEAGVLVSGTNGIVINAGATDVVVLRGLDIYGVGTGLNGIQILNAKAVHVEKCTIRRFTQSGIRDASPTIGSLIVSDTIISENAVAGVSILPPVGITLVASLTRVEASNNAVGVNAQGGGSSLVSINDSTISNSTGNGVNANTNVNMNISRSAIVGNSGTALNQAGAGTTIRIGNSTVSQNNIALGGTISTYGTNMIDGNGNNNYPALSAIVLH